MPLNIILSRRDFASAVQYFRRHAAGNNKKIKDSYSLEKTVAANIRLQHPGRNDRN
jgi:hypothetical protein